MTLIEERAKQGIVPCLKCNGKTFCTAMTRDKCGLYKAWEEYRQEAYRQHLRWMERMCSFGQDR